MFEVPVNTDRPTEPNVDCAHKQADHYHGTYACYVLDRCRCGDCREANTLYEKQRRRWTGEFPTLPEPYVDADRARELVAELRARGMGLKTIAKQSGVAHGTLWKLVYGQPGRGPSKRCRPETVQNLEDTLEALEWEEATLADGAKVDGREARQIIRELVKRGWTKADIGRRVHGPQARSLQVRGRQVTAGTLRILRGLLLEPVPFRVHNPTGKLYQPEGGPARSVPRLVDGVGGQVAEKVTTADRILDVLDVEGWMTYAAIAERLDIPQSSISTVLKRLGCQIQLRNIDGRNEAAINHGPCECGDPKCTHRPGDWE